MIITVGNIKGGSGKTTVAVNLAIARARSAHSVWLIDADHQGTAQKAMSIRSEAHHKPGIACATYADPSILRTQVKQQSKKFDDVIIDAGGRDTPALREAVQLSDALLVPFQPYQFDYWALKDMETLVTQSRNPRSGLRCFAVLNCAEPGAHSSDNAQAQQAIEQVPMFNYLSTPLVRRKAFANSAGAGQCVMEYKPSDPKANAELKHLIKVLFK